MIAVTSRSRNVMETWRTTSAAPKNALSRLASRRTRAGPPTAAAGADAVGRGTRGDSVATTAESGARRETGCKADNEDNTNEDQRTSPRERMLRVVRADREIEDL